MPRVALACEFGTVSGGERSLLAVLAELRLQSEWEFVALAPAHSPLAREFEQLRVPIIPFDSHPQGAPREDQQALNALSQALDLCQPDLLHTNGLSLGKVTGPAAAIRSLPAVCHLRDIMKLSAAAVARLNQQSAFIAVSHAVARFHAAQGLSVERTHVIYNGVNSQKFQKRPATGWLHRELNIPANALLLGTIGQICLRKGQDLLARAAQQIVDRHPLAHFVLVGDLWSQKPESRAYASEIKNSFTAAGIAGHLHQLSYRDDIHLVMNELTLLIHPARQEPLGRVLLESLFSELPVVATDVGGTREILKEGLAGWLVPSGEIQALASAVFEAIDSPDLCKLKTECGREHAKANFNSGTSANQVATLWRALAR